MNFEERAVSFLCNDSWLFGILCLPERALARGVLIVTGGPQYRAGSHRQFVLLARYLAAGGVPVMRFDYRGMGDSEGDVHSFEDVEDDIRHAIDRFFAEASEIREIVIWGLCDAASAALVYACRDPRVCGLVLLNPWARTEQGIARTYLKHYYLTRIFDRELWNKITHGRFDYGAAVRSVFNVIGAALPAGRKNLPHAEAATGEQSCGLAPLPERMFDGLNRFNGKVLLIMSGRDLTAQGFSDLVTGSRKWRKLLESSRIQRRDLPQANHTFSRCDWREQVSSWTREWLRSW